MSDSEIPDIVDVQRRLGLRDRPRPRMAGVIEPWALPFAIDIALGREEGSSMSRGARSSLRTTSAVTGRAARHRSRNTSRTRRGPVRVLAAAGGGIGAAVGAYATRDPLLLLAVPAGIVVCGAAHGLSEALRIGLRAKLLTLMGVDDPGTDRGDPEPPSS
jgi:hypothetical protein